MAILKVRNLKKSYGRINAVNRVDLDVNEGEIVVIMGPSGCGKSTLIRSINRLVEPDEGLITFDGIDITGLKHRELLLIRRRIGYVFQHFNLIERLTVLDNVMLGLVFSGMERDEAEDRAVKVLRRVGLESRLLYRPSALSGGEKQRVGLARAIALEPELMLLDEPTAALDPILVKEVLDSIEEMVSTSKTTMLIVTHEVRFARRVAHRIVLMDKGKIIEQGKPEHIFTSPISELGRRYQGLIA